MPAAVSEKRRTLAVDEGFELPKLPGDPLPGRSFTSFHHDTPDRSLEVAGLSLTRLMENGRSLWQLEFPRGKGRARVAAAGGPAAPPERIRKLLVGVVRGNDLVLTETIRTRRAGIRVREDEQDIANVLLDQVSVLDGHKVSSSTTQLEVHPLEGGKRAVERIEKKLGKAGASAARPESEDKAPDEAAPPSEHVRARLAAQYADILGHDPGVRLGGDPEDLHRLRVGIRRARAVLRSARPFLDGEWTDHLRAELGWLGRALGPARDLDVLHEGLMREVQSFEKLDAGGFERMLDELREQRAAARGDVLKVLRSQRYLRLLDSLADAAEAVPVSGSGPSVTELAAKEFGRLQKTMKSLDDRPTDENLHKARIRAKRARYAAEVAEPAVGKRASEFVDRAKTLQDVLGSHQDAVVAEDAIRRLGRGSGTRAAFVAGRLVERQRISRRRARRSVAKGWKKLERAGERAWA
jgi:CHAD domain-containing protein